MKPHEPLSRVHWIDMVRQWTPLRVLAVLPVVVVCNCAGIPKDIQKEVSTAYLDTQDTSLAALSTKWRDNRLDESGFYPLQEGRDAFGMRLSLMDAAAVSIDAQYFLMKPDDAGLVFSAGLLDAADRGVRVRLLLDDIFTTLEDSHLHYLDAHPNIEVRIFNPISRKGIYGLNYVAHFNTANRRMHNKSLIADNQFAIVGGRNIAAEYFQLETTGEFIDFDMLCAGFIVRQVSASFDRYWNDDFAIPMSVLTASLPSEVLDKGSEHIQKAMNASGNTVYADSLNTTLMQRVFEHEIPSFLAPARVIVDDPEKLKQPAGMPYQVVATEITKALEHASDRIIIFTPYFIPGKSGMELLQRIREAGVEVILVTNSLASNNHTAVHSAYSGYRKDLLRMGITLWEARANAATIVVHEDETTLKEPLTLHTKGILIDDNIVFVGSLNLDPRSIDINTEMGILIESQELAEVMIEEALSSIPEFAYRLQLSEKGKLQWTATVNDEFVIENREPLTSWWRRFSAWFLKIAPERQL